MTQHRAPWRSPAGALFLLLLGGPAASWAGEGFGMIMTRKVIWLERLRPPEVHIAGTRIAVRVKAQDSRSEAVAQRLQSQIESELLSADKRFSSDPQNPQTVVEVALVENQAAERWETRRETRSRDTGNKDSKGKKIYREVEVDVRYQVLNARAGITYKVIETRTGRNLNADSISWSLQRDYREGSGAPTLGALESEGLESIVRTLVPRLTPTPEKVGALLPKGSLDDLGNLARAGLWGKYQEALATLSPRPRPEDESYRQYAMGLAYEALGYAAETFDQTLKYLQQAAIHYDRALEANPEEKYFSQAYDRKSLGFPGESGGFVRSQTLDPPHKRVKTALIQYQKLAEARAEDEKLAAGGTAGTALPGAKGVEAARDANVLDNTGVIRLVDSGLPESIILNAIDGAEKTDFDLSTNGLIGLSQAGVPAKIIAHMQKVAQQRRPENRKGRSGS